MEKLQEYLLWIYRKIVIQAKGRTIQIKEGEIYWCSLGENIGDLGGINAAYDGLQLYLKENKNPGLIDGFTPEQRLFISWATIWRSKMRDEALKNQVKTDPHSPGMYRAYVPIQNLDTFYQAFNIKEGDGMYVAPDKRVKIW